MNHDEKQNDTQQEDESTDTPASEESANGASSESSTEASKDVQEERDASPEQQLANLKDQLLRKAAEFENYKRRTESEMQSLVRYANEHLVLEILPIVDDLERSLKTDTNAEDAASFRTGVELIYQKLQKVLETHGVTALETAGKPFDVHYHDAMMQMPKADVDPNTILEEVEKGYSMNGKVIRHAKVIVSAAVEDTAETDPKGDTE